MVSAITKWIIAIFVVIFILPTLITFLTVSNGIESFNPNFIWTTATIIGIIAPFLLVAGLFYWIFTFQKRRQRDLMKTSSELGLSYGSDDGEKYYNEIKNFEVFDKGFLPQIWHIITGKWKDIPIVVFDYRYKAGVVAKGLIHYQTLVYAKVNNANYKKTKIERNGFIIEAEGKKVICYKRSYYVKPRDLKNFLDETLGYVKNI